MKDGNDENQWKKNESDSDQTEELEEADREAAELEEDALADEADTEASELEFEKENEIDEQEYAHSADNAAMSTVPSYWKWTAIGSLVAAVILAILLAVNPFDGNKTLAKVNGKVIAQNQVFDILFAQGGQQILDDLISEELFNQELAKEKIKISDAEVTAFLDKVGKQQFPGEGEFDAFLVQQNITLENVKKQLTKTLQLRKVFSSQVKFTDEEAKQIFDENPSLSTQSPEKIKASHILLATQEEADAILLKLKSGSNFAILAKEKSIDPTAKDSGGDLGEAFDATTSGFDATFVAAAFGVAEGAISEVVPTEFGFHIIKVTQRIPAVLFSFDSKKEDIKELMMDQKINQELLAPWLAELRTKADIEFTNPTPEPAAPVQ